MNSRGFFCCLLQVAGVFLFIYWGFPGWYPLWGYQWPLPAEQTEQGFLSGRTKEDTKGPNPLPNLGLWFGLDETEESKGVVQPYHPGETIYFEQSSQMNILGPLPRNIEHTMIVQHEKLLIRYSGKQLPLRLQNSYELENQATLFTQNQSPTNEDAEGQASEAQGPQLYIEVFDTQSQTVINPMLIMPGGNIRSQRGQPYLESLLLSDVSGLNEPGDANNGNTQQGIAAPVNRPLRLSEQLLSGIYNLIFRFPQRQGPPLRLYVDIDQKRVYSQLFDQVYAINSRLMINDRDLQDIYVADTQQGRFFLGTLNFQDKVNSTIRIQVVEEYMDGSQSRIEYRLQIR